MPEQRERYEEDAGGQRLRGYRLDQLEKTFEEFERRVLAIEVELPTMKLIRNWVIAGAFGVLSLVGVAVVALVLR
jgi:hypothetical protein